MKPMPGDCITVEISEQAFEEVIETSLFRGSPDSTLYDDNVVAEVQHSYPQMPRHGYQKRRGKDYDRTLCLIVRDVLDFVLATQPQEWKKLAAHHGEGIEEKFLQRLSSEIGRRGTLDVMRNEIRDMGCKFQLAYFHPASGLNEDTHRLYEGNLFSVVRQLQYSTQNNKSLDLALFLNGIPIFTAELKTPLTGQDVQDAIRQYRQDRDPREPLFSHRRCLAHFAVDPDLVYVTTRLTGSATYFLPFNQGKYGGAGNPPVLLSQHGYATSYSMGENIVATLQKFPFIAREISELSGQRFALIVDEAHSSQSGETSKSLKAVLSSQTLQEAETADTEWEKPDEEVESRILADIARRGPQPNISTFAFTATPKPKILELFGTRQAAGTFVPFHIYSMRQAIEEGFILDTLAHYTTYRSYWKLCKRIESAPRYDKAKATSLLKSFVDLHPHAIRQKVAIMLDHFVGKAQSEIKNQAKAMIVTRSRLHAVRYRLEVDRYIAQQGYGFKALVAFSGTVQDGGQSYTEAGMNGFPETQTASIFEQPDYRLLIVASKFQTGFDQPLLHTMYVDRKLGGVNAVQTLSRINRIHPNKESTRVLDFANEADEIKAAFEPYYETTVLSEETDPNLLYTLQNQLGEIPVFTDSDVKDYTDLYFTQPVQEQLYSALAPMSERFLELARENRREFRRLLTDYVRQYAFLSQVLPFADPDLERLYVFARHLRNRLPLDREELPLEIRNNIDMESFRIQQTGSGKVELARQRTMVHPLGTGKANRNLSQEEAFLSEIIAELNDHFGIDLGLEHRVTLRQVMQKLEADVALERAVRVNTEENIRLAFNEKVNQFIQEIVDSNFELYRRINDDVDFGHLIRERLFEYFLHSHGTGQEAMARDRQDFLSPAKNP